MSDGYSPRPMGALRVSLLGSFRASVGDAALPAGGVKQRAVLAMLALRAGDAVPESRLIDGIWGDETPSAVRSSLQVYVAHWRRVLGESGTGAHIEREGVGYRLVMEPADVDVNRYGSLVALGRAALLDERYVVAAGRFDEAQALWRGDALQDFEGMPFHQWETASLESARVQALADRGDALLGAGRGSELVAALEGLVARYPYEERFRAQLMHALYRSGRQVDAMRVCEQARSTLIEVGIEAGPLLRSMEHRVLQQDPSLESKASPFTPVGPPEPLTSLIGREQQVADLVHLTSRGGNRLVTLTGPGGVGKSRLVLEVANRVLEEGWMPVAYLALNEALDESLVPQAVNGVFGVPESWRERPVAEVARMLGDSPLLVVVDGAEHVLGAVRTVVSELLQHGRQLHVLVTSRVALGLNGERQVPLGPLGCGSDDGTPPRSAPAVALFIERAERFQSGLQFDDSAVRVIAEICEGVDGLPLAIELAAARSGTMGVEGLRRRLGSRLDLLAAPHQSGERRHRSLREVIAWSHGLLSGDAQRLLARLSVLSGGFELEHVEEMWGDIELDTPLLDSFEELDRHSMLARVPGRSAPRFRLLDTVREFAVEQLTRLGETEDAYRRLRRWVHARVDAVGGRVGAGAMQFDPLALEVDNVRAAVAWALEHAPTDAAADLCNKLYVWWMVGGRAEELGRWLREASRRESAPTLRRAWLLLYLGRVDGRKDRVADSQVALADANAIFSANGASDGVVHSLTSIVENLVHERRFAEAGHATSEALTLAADSADPEVRCRALHAACWLAGSTGDLDRSRSFASELLRETSAAGLVDFEAKTLADLAWINRVALDTQSAFDWANQAVSRALVARTGGAVVSAYTEVALACLAMGDYPSGIQAVTAGLTFESGDDLSPTSVLRVSLALAALAEGEGDDDVFQLAAALIGTVRAVNVALTVWPADELLVGEIYRRLCARRHVHQMQATDVDALRQARSLGNWLRQNRTTNGSCA